MKTSKFNINSLKSFVSILTICFSFSCMQAIESVKTDLLIIGGGASGVAAGIQSSRLGVKALIIEETPWLGGMLTSAGVSATDGNYYLPSGIWGEFRDSLANYYGGLDSLKTGWVSNVQFEPSVGNKIFNTICSKENNLKVIHNYFVKRIKKEKNNSWRVYFTNKVGKELSVQARFIIDATELGDVIPLVGVKYDLGMESRNKTKEDVAPETSNNIIQDLTYCAVLKDYGRDVTIQKPADYRPAEFACCAENPQCITPKEPDRMWSKEKMITYGKLPNNKYMINWPIEGNDFYVNLVEMTREQREKAIQQAKNYTMNFVYFIQHELGYNTLGLADDEFDTPDRLPYIPYYRESRRVHGKVRFTCNHVTLPYSQEQPLYRTNIAVGDYPVDHHHTRYNGKEELPRLYFHPVPSFGVPLGTIIPEGVENMLVAEKSISVSNIINGSTRLQPVVLQIGQVAGIVASLALKNNKSVNDVKVREVQNIMLDNGGYIQPYLDAEKGSKLFKPYQRIGSTGILEGEGRNVDWIDQFWLRTDTLLLHKELKPFVKIYPSVIICDLTSDRAVNTSELVNMISQAINKSMSEVDIKSRINEILKRYGFGGYDEERQVTRGEFAIVIDELLDPFNKLNIDINGNFTDNTNTL